MLFNNRPYLGQKKASLSLRLGATFGILYLNTEGSPFHHSFFLPII